MSKLAHSNDETMAQIAADAEHAPDEGRAITLEINRCAQELAGRDTSVAWDLLSPERQASYRSAAEKALRQSRPDLPI